MKDIAYRQMYENELSHGWYLGTRNLLKNILLEYSYKEAKILDAGCGTGGTIKLLQAAGFKNILGVDKSSLAIRLCRKRGLKNVSIANINQLPFKNKSFDVIICLNVLYHHGINLKKTLREFSRVLKRGGILYVQEPAYSWLKSHHDIAIETQRRFTKDQVQKLIKPFFKIVKLTYFNFLLFLPIALKRLIDKFSSSRKASSDVVRLNPMLNQSLKISLDLESKIIKIVNLPFGLSIICLAQKK